MKKINKILSIILAMLMVISIIPITASAATYSGKCGDNATWTYDSSTYTLTISGAGDMYDYKSNNRPWESYEDNIKVVTIEDGITMIGNYAFYHCGKMVTAILPDSITSVGEYAFKECRKLESINIPDGIETIKSNTFNHCQGLTDITIPNGVTAIEKYAFYACDGLTDITIPDSVTIIGYFAFGYCDVLANVTIGRGVTTIESSAFYGCKNLTTITIPKNVALIEHRVFANCENLTSIIVDKDSQYYMNDEYGALYSKDKTFLVQYPIAHTRTSYTILDGVKTIEEMAFYNCLSLTNITFPDGVETINYCAFNGCENITSIILPDGVITIDGSAFGYCPNLQNITIPESVTRISSNAVTYGTTIIYYGGTANQWKQLLANNSPSEGGYLENNVVYCADRTVFPSGACGDNLTWTYNNLTGVLTISGTGDMYGYGTHPTSCTDAPWAAFLVDIKEVVIEDGVMSIGSYAFYRCSNLSDVIIGDGVTTIAGNAFSYCDSLISVTIGNGVTTIEEYAFYECEGLTSVIIPVSVTNMDNDAFYGCPGITDVYYEGTEEQWLGYYVYPEGSLINLNRPFTKSTIHYNYHIHKYDSTVTPPTCTEQGYTAYTCECGDSYVDDYVDALGHNYKNGVCDVCGIFTGIKDNHIYKDGVMQKAYQLVEVDGDIYYIGDRHEIVKNKKVYIKAERTNDLTFADGTPITAGWYEFDENGKMVIVNGIVGNKIYKNNTQLKAYQLVEVDGEFYYIGDRHEIVKNKKVYIKAERLNDLTYEDGTSIQAGFYTFDENGKMIILDGIVGNKVYKNNVQLKAYQLVEVNGDFYYIGDRHEIVKDKRVYVKAERTNDLTYADGTLIQAGWYNFDADGKMIVE